MEREATIQRVARAIEDHLPDGRPLGIERPAGLEDDCTLLATMLVSALEQCGDSGAFRRISVDDEMQRLQDMVRHARALQTSYRRLHWTMRNVFSRNAPDSLVREMDDLAESVGRAVKAARPSAKKIRNSDGGDVRAFQIVDGCRAIWQLRTGRPPSSKYMNDKKPGPFGRFLIAVLDALGEDGSASAKMRTWRTKKGLQ